MRYHLLAVDYDGTIAHHGKVDPATVDVLNKCKQSARKVVLVTGRELDELKELFPEYKLFDLIVAENGALVYDPASGQETLLGERPPKEFIDRLFQQNVSPLSVGRVIVATWEPHQSTVLHTIKEAGIDYQVIFNKGAVMILPPGINKAKGLEVALDMLRLSRHNVVAVGDAENDLAMMALSECPVAVANAIDTVKDKCTFTTTKDHGAGVAEVIEMLLDDDMASISHEIRRQLSIGSKADGQDFTVSAYRAGMLLAGSSGGGKSTFTTAFTETLKEAGYQFCLIDPEGDYIGLPDAVTVGDADHEPAVDEIMGLLQISSQNIVVSLLALALDRRPAFFNDFIGRLADLRAKTSRPHWLIIDESNHLLPTETEESYFSVPNNLGNVLLITTTPDRVNKSIYNNIEAILVLGGNPSEALAEFAQIKGQDKEFTEVPLPRGQAWWWDTSSTNPTKVILKEPIHTIQRHVKKYATGNMQYNEFFFKGPEGKLNLKAYNVISFIQLAEGVDDGTWTYHLNEHGYSKWFSEALHDEELAQEAEKIELLDTNAAVSKKKILDMLRQRFTL